MTRIDLVPFSFLFHHPNVVLLSQLRQQYCLRVSRSSPQAFFLGSDQVNSLVCREKHSRAGCFQSLEPPFGVRNRYCNNRETLEGRTSTTNTLTRVHLLSLDFFVQPHGHELSKGDAFSARDSFRYIKGIHTKTNRVPGGPFSHELLCVILKLFNIRAFRQQWHHPIAGLLCSVFSGSLLIV